MLLIWISLVLLWSEQFCDGTNHWIVTEDGRIQQQMDSIFNLKKPYDLVAFIQQEEALEKLTSLKEELTQEKKWLESLAKKEDTEFQNKFYLSDPDCTAAEASTQSVDVFHRNIVPFSSKGINIAKYIELDSAPSPHPRPPYCKQDLPFSMTTFDHLEGVRDRQELRNVSEHSLQSSMPYIKDVDQWGDKVRASLNKNKMSWVLLNLAAYYWRIKGNGVQAVECLRRALYTSPREHRDVALMSLAIALHRANHSMDSVVLIHTSLEVTKDLFMHHFVLGHIYTSLEMFELAELCFRYVIGVAPSFGPAVDGLHRVMCETKLRMALVKKQKMVQDTLQKLEDFQRSGRFLRNREHVVNRQEHVAPEHAKQQLKEFLENKDRVAQVHVKPGEVVNKEEISPSPSMPRIHFTDQDIKLSDKEMKDIRQEILKGYEKSDHAEKFTVNVNLHKESQESGNTKYFCKKNPNPQETQRSVRSKEKKKNRRKTSSKTTNGAGDSGSQPKAKKKNSTKPEPELSVAEFLLQAFDKVMGSEDSEKATEDAGHAKDGEGEGETENKTADREVRDAGKEKSRVLRKRGESGQKERKKTAEKSRLATRKNEGLATGTKRGKQKGDTSEIRSTVSSIQEREALWEEEARRDTAGQENAVVGPKHTPPELTTHSSCEGFNEEGEKKRRKGDKKYMECSRKLESAAVGGQQRQKNNQLIKEEQEQPQQKRQQEIQPEQRLEQLKNERLKQEGQRQKELKQELEKQNKQVKKELKQKDQQHEQLQQQQQLQQKKQKDHLKQQEPLLQQEKQQQQEQQQQQQQQKQEDREASGSTTTPDGNAEFAVHSNSHSREANIPPGSSKGLAEQNTGNNFDDEKVIDNSMERKNKEENMGEGSVVAKSENARESPERKVNFSKLVEQESSIEAAIIGTGAESLSNSPVTPASGTSKGGDRAQEVSGVEVVGNVEETTENFYDFYTTAAGSSVFEARILSVMTDGSVQELNDDRCQHIHGFEALVLRNKKFSAWMPTEIKKVNLRSHLNVPEQVSGTSKQPRCQAKTKNSPYTFDHLEGIEKATSLKVEPEKGLMETLLSTWKSTHSSLENIGTRVYLALQKNSTSWVLLNVASLYWRVVGNTAEAIRCLQQALYFSPPNARDVAQVSLSSVLLRAGFLEDAEVVIKTALEISPSLVVGHLVLGNILGAKGLIPQATHHYLTVLRLEPGFTPAIERLKIIQCVLWLQQRELEKEAEELRKLLTTN